MSNLILPVSLGEGLDKLSILDIKISKIKDERKENCLKEYNELYEILKQYIDSLSYHYRILKEINLTIWNLQENIHNDTNLTKTYGEVLKENDRRFRMKKKINNIMNSSLKEEKGYNFKKCYYFAHQGLGDHLWCNGAVRYLATCYDEPVVVLKLNKEAIVHSMVEFIDGSCLAQLSIPDMRIPIQYALTYPERRQGFLKGVNFSKVARLSFQEPDLDKFPCLDIARQAARQGGTYPAVLCASDEEVVKNYLNGRIKFSDIAKIIAKVMKRHKSSSAKTLSLDDVLDAGMWAKEEARSICYR